MHRAVLAAALLVGLGCKPRTLDPHAPKLVYRTAPEATDRTVQVLRARLDRMKVVSRVKREGDAIVVSVEPDAFEQAHRILGRQGKLEFVMVDDSADANAAAQAIALPAEVTLEHASWLTAGQSHAQAFFRANTRAPLAGLAKLVPPNWRLAVQHNTKYDGTEEWLGMMLATSTPIDNGAIQDAEVTFDSQTNRPEVNVTLTPAAADEFARLTSEHLGAKLAIVLDGEIQSAPIIQSRIPGGKVRITMGSAADPGQLQQEAKDLVAVLRVGALPAPLELIRMENK
jgi:preprotein translocase subunit SecD